MKPLFETGLPQNWSRRLFEDFAYDVAAEHCDKVMNILFTSAAEILKSSKNLNTPALVFERVDGTFVAASFLTYFPNEDPEQPGNWTLSWTFDENDIPEDASVIKFANNDQAYSFVRGIAGSKYGMTFIDSSAIVSLMVVTLEEIKKYLDENAKEGETVGVKLDGIFQARVAVENGIKVFALEADGLIKVLIKDDEAIAK